MPLREGPGSSDRACLLGDDKFLQRLDERRRWIAENCKRSFIIDDLDDDGGQTIGKLYRFADLYEAIHFRMRF
jgi:hypothetical protein